MSSEYLTVTNFDYRTYLPEKPVPVLINCPGGSNQFATPIYDWIKLHGVDTIAEGTCQSFAFCLFSAGKRRISYPSTVFMVHGSSVNGGGIMNVINRKRNKDKFNEIFWQPWLDRMVQISNKPRSFWADTIKDSDRHFYFSAKELKAMGVVTHIIGEDI